MPGNTPRRRTAADQNAAARARLLGPGTQGGGRDTWLIRQALGAAGGDGGGSGQRLGVAQEPTKTYDVTETLTGPMVLTLGGLWFLRAELTLDVIAGGGDEETGSLYAWDVALDHPTSDQMRALPGDTWRSYLAAEAILTVGDEPVVVLPSFGFAGAATLTGTIRLSAWGILGLAN